MDINVIYNIKAEDLMPKMAPNCVDIILTSPPYNTTGKKRLGHSDMYNKRYDTHSDFMSDEEYINWTIEIFKLYDRVLKNDGVICYNMSYSSENTSVIWRVVSAIIEKTNFTTADTIVWKKKNAIPNNRSKNKLTRICEYIFVFVRKNELKTFNTNKKIVSIIEGPKQTGQANYENIYNFIEAKNNDGVNNLNKATFSTELVTRLLDIYGTKNGLCYDSFMGIGTTANACIKWGMNYIGSEKSAEQVEYFTKKQNNNNERK